MRSSIACTRCRRSKIKCVNAGIDTTCRACESSGRDCQYPAPTIGVKRDIATTADGEDRNGDWDSPKRPRPRKATSTAGSNVKDAAKGSSDLLDSSVLTVKVWESLFDIFQSHFATVLPFIHPTFPSQIRQLSALQPDGLPNMEHSQSPVPKPELSPLILLGVLTLTARFHPQLIALHSPAAAGSPSNPLVASEYYASALRSRLAGVDGMGLILTDLTRVQAMLMLAWHEWGMCRGKNAWLYGGMAIRLAQAIGLPFALENEPSPREGSRPPGSKGEAEPLANCRRRESREQNSDDVIAQETKRRTFWACFIIDRCLSSGKYRPRMIRVKDLEIQLPSDNAFAFGERVRTSRLRDSHTRRPPGFDSPVPIPTLRQGMAFADDKLRPNGSTETKSWSPIAHRKDSVDHDVDRWEIGAEESVLSRVIRILRIWGCIAKWACGGRRYDDYAPWQSESRFSQLRCMLGDFQDSLPRNQQYSQRNTDTHIMYKHTLASYVMMHIIYFLSVIVLHRAYLPFLPLRCSEPEGPLDDLLFPKDKYGMPDGFWRDSARELFRAARLMLDLVITCQDRGVLVETPLIGFAIYNASFIGVYAAHFGYLDQEGSLSSFSKSNTADPSVPVGTAGQIQTRRALEILREMKRRLNLAVGWLRTIHRLHSYFLKAKKDFRRSSRKLDIMSASDSIDAHPNGIRLVRDSALEDLKTLGRLFYDYGNVEDRVSESGGLEDDGTTSFIPVNNDRGATASDAGSNVVKSEAGEGSDTAQLDGSAARRESWVPVNTPVHGLPLSSGPETDQRPRSELDRRPSLPLPLTRPMGPQCIYALPSIQHHTHTPLPTTSSGLPSLTSPGNYASPPTNPTPSQYLTTPSTTRLHPINSWVTSNQQPSPSPYSQSLPPINAPAQQGSSVLPGLAAYAPTSSAAVASDGADPPLWSVSFGGDDVIAFIDGGGYEQWPSLSASEVGNPAGWLSLMWNDFTR